MQRLIVYFSGNPPCYVCCHGFSPVTMALVPFPNPCVPTPPPPGPLQSKLNDKSVHESHHMVVQTELGEKRIDCCVMLPTGENNPQTLTSKRRGGREMPTNGIAISCKREVNQKKKKSKVEDEEVGGGEVLCKCF